MTTIDHEDLRVCQKLPKLCGDSKIKEDDDTLIALSDYKTDKFKHPLPISKMLKSEVKNCNDLLMDSLEIDFSESTRATQFQNENSLPLRTENMLQLNITRK